MAQHLLKEGNLLNNEGNLIEAGYAFSLVKKYEKAQIKAPKWRIKEWDYYYLGNAQYGLALTVADNGYHSLCSITLLDFEKKKEVSKSFLSWFTMGKLGLPETSIKGDILVEDKKKKYMFSFAHLEDGRRRIIANCEDFGPYKRLFHCDLFLESTCKDSMVIATPFNKKAHFYYNQKVNCLKASGYAKVGNDLYSFDNTSYGVLDWGRGVWTYKNTWYWSSLNAIQDGHVLGFNLGYGFGDTSQASENMFFYDGKAYKLEDVRMDIPLGSLGKDDFMRPWTFRSKSGDIAMTFTPIYDRHSDTNALLIRSNQHQVFGTFSGTITAEGKVYEIHDLLGFAEKVYNRW